MNTINKTEQYLFTTWLNIPADTMAIYKGSDGKLYSKRYGLPHMELETDFAMHLAWCHINRTVGWPCHIPDGGTWIDRTVSISKEAQDMQCKMILSIN